MTWSRIEAGDGFGGDARGRAGRPSPGRAHLKVGAAGPDEASPESGREMSGWADRSGLERRSG